MRVLDLCLDPDPADLEPVRVLDPVQQLVGHLDVAGRADLRQHQRVELAAGLLDYLDQVAVVVGRIGRVDADGDRRGGEVERLQRLDHAGAGEVLLVSGGGVLEVEKDLVGVEARRLREEPLARPRHGLAAATQPRRALSHRARS